jgi:hypothetical protein
MDQDGFEYTIPGEDEATFFPWTVTDGGKDLMLIDHFTHLPIHEFFTLIDDEFDRSRAPILLAMMATSIRAKHTDWTPERIIRTVQNLKISEVTMVDAEEDEAPRVDPPAEESTGAKPSSGSKSSATRPDSSPSETSPAIPA